MEELTEKKEEKDSLFEQRLTIAAGKKAKKKPLDKELVQKIIKEVRIQQKRRYGEKMKGDGSGYEPKSKTYKTEHLYDDLEFILNHIHFD